MANWTHNRLHAGQPVTPARAAERESTPGRWLACSSGSWRLASDWSSAPSTWRQIRCVQR